MASGVVESAAARYQVQSRVAGRAVNGSCRETGLKVSAYAGDAEDGGDPVGERHVDPVPGAEGPQAEEHRRAVVAVEVTFDDRRPDLAGRYRVLEPCGLIGRRVKRRDPDRAVGVDSQVQQSGVHANGRDIDGHW